MTEATDLVKPHGAAPIRAPRVAINVVGGKVEFELPGVNEANPGNLGLGDVSSAFAQQAVAQLLNLAFVSRLDLLAGDAPDGPADAGEMNALIALVYGIEPRDDLECAMAMQLAMLHHTSLDCARRAQAASTPHPVRMENLSHAGKLSRSFAMLLDALSRHRGKVTTQRVVVEQVNVQAGGQAVVGAVAGVGAGAKQKSGKRAHAQRDESRPRRAALPSPQSSRAIVSETGEQGKEALSHARRREGKRSAEGQPERADARPVQRRSNRNEARDSRAAEERARSSR